MNTFFRWFSSLFELVLPPLRAPIRSPQREAILLAADFLDKNPERYNFMDGRLQSPKSGESACALSWIGTFSGEYFKDYHVVAERFLGLSPKGYNPAAFTFYDRLEELDDPSRRIYCRWMDETQHLVPLLRKYADRYYPEIG